MSLFSLFKLAVDAAEDSSLSEPVAHGAAAVTQVKDQKAFVSHVTIAPGASELNIDFSSTLSTGYRWAIFSDYPVLVRPNGVSATQHTLVSGNVSATNIGAPLPYQCFLAGTGQLTSMRVAPISGAQNTANVKLIVIGDPTNSYT